MSSRTNDLVLYWGVDSDGVIRDAAFRAGLQLRICPPELLLEASARWWEWARSVGLTNTLPPQMTSTKSSGESVVQSSAGHRESRPLAILLADENLQVQASRGQPGFIEQGQVAIIHKPKYQDVSPPLSRFAMTWLQNLRRSTHLDRDSLQIA